MSLTTFKVLASLSIPSTLTSIQPPRVLFAGRVGENLGNESANDAQLSDCNSDK